MKGLFLFVLGLYTTLTILIGRLIRQEDPAGVVLCSLLVVLIVLFKVIVFTATEEEQINKGFDYRPRGMFVFFMFLLGVSSILLGNQTGFHMKTVAFIGADLIIIIGLLLYYLPRKGDYTEEGFR
jgi:Kef-type K+ transport system membrane component KefB